MLEESAHFACLDDDDVDEDDINGLSSFDKDQSMDINKLMENATGSTIFTL